jgi:hypothetical protein
LRIAREAGKARLPLLSLKEISLTFGATALLSGATCHPDLA